MTIIIIIGYQTGVWRPTLLLPLSLLPLFLSLLPCLTLLLSSLSFLILAVCEESDLSPTQTINVCLPGQRRTCNITEASYALCLQSVRAREMEVRRRKAMMLAERKIEQRTKRKAYRWYWIAYQHYYRVLAPKTPSWSISVTLQTEDLTTWIATHHNSHINSCKLDVTLWPWFSHCKHALGS